MRMQKVRAKENDYDDPQIHQQAKILTIFDLNQYLKRGRKVRGRLDGRA